MPKITFALNYYFDGFRPFGYHLVNLVIHLSTALFLFLLAKTTLLIIKTRGHNEATHAAHTAKDTSIFWISAAAALLWAVHPQQVQSVSYIVQRMNSMAALFFIVSLFCYAQGRIRSGKRAIICFGISLLSGTFSCLSKENAATLPFFILLYEWYFFQDISLDFFKKRIIIFSIAVMSGLGFLLFYSINIGDKILSFYNFQPFTLKQRLLTELRVVWFYISQLFYPHPTRLSLEHDFSLSSSFLDPPITLVAGLSIIIMLTGAIFWAKKHRLLSFCLLWFLGNLIIESSIIGLALVYEHRMYMPSMFLIIGLVYICSHLITWKWAQIFIVLLSIIVLSHWTYQRNIIWGNEYLFGRDAVGKNPDNGRVHYNFAKTLESMKRFDEAIVEYNETLRVSPGNAYAHNNLGAIYQDRGHVDKAIYHFKRAVKLKPNNTIAKSNLRFLMIYKSRLSKQKNHGQ